MLTDRIYLSGQGSEEPEDFFGESLGVIFPGKRCSGVILFDVFIFFTYLSNISLHTTFKISGVIRPRL